MFASLRKYCWWPRHLNPFKKIGVIAFVVALTDLGVVIENRDAALTQNAACSGGRITSIHVAVPLLQQASLNVRAAVRAAPTCLFHHP